MGELYIYYYLSIKKSDPKSMLQELTNYIFTAGYKLAEGRNFTLDEVQQGKHMVIIGEEVKKRFWLNPRL